ncbi:MULTISPECIES: alpha-L-fucosidase [Butyricimonas]|uniref:alpha-L-fucosidase n=1 Tax=Butyricimonas TaxID=574697 RepID=UPI0009F3BC00|nr:MULTISPECIES: alpha-L-fucosidase [Butyricimonas]
MLLRGCLIIILLGVQFAFGQQKPDPDWVSQKFSMFIHWGLYSELGGVWKGEPVRAGYSEQIQSFGRIPKAEYEAVAKRFNPEKWNADEVVALAKAAGMKSIVFTSKHHDGFCMYHSKYTKYNIVDATPFKRDVMKELSDACLRQGVKFAVYYSLIDWNFPGNGITPHNADAISPKHHEFSMKQVEEIMTNYGPVSEIWFDMGSLTAEQSKELYNLVTRLQPQCMVSGRLGNDRGDFAVMGDNKMPDHKIGVPWQTAASFFDETWGYRSWQNRGDLDAKINEKIGSLVKVVSRGGNYLLNIGPRGDGSVVEFERDALLAMGKWLKSYGEAIYCTTSNPFDGAPEWGDITCKGNNLYLFVEKMPENRVVELKGVIGKVKNAVLLVNEQILNVKQNGQTVSVNIPQAVQADRGIVVIKLVFEDGFRAIPDQVLRTKVLTTANAIPVYAHSSMDYYSSYRSTVGFAWHFEKKGMTVTPTIVYTEGDQDKVLRLTIDGQVHDITLTGGNPVSLNVNPNSLNWGNVYMFNSKGGAFAGSATGLRKTFDPIGDGWKLQPNLKPGESVKILVEAKESVEILHEFTSDREQDVLVEIAVADGTQLILNGERVLLRSFVGGVPRDNQVVKLHVRKGKNLLVVQLYNRFGKEVTYLMNPNVKQEEYKLRLNPIKLYPGNIHDCTLEQAHPANKNSDMGSRDIRVELE